VDRGRGHSRRAGHAAFVCCAACLLLLAGALSVLGCGTEDNDQRAASGVHTTELGTVFVGSTDGDSGLHVEVRDDSP
jgi:hypothetical protein